MVFDWLKRLIQNQSINQSDESINQSISDIRLQKDSLELGMAAGYAGHSLKSLESAMERLESSVITKQWAEAYLLPFLKSIDDNEQRRFETLLSLLNYLKGTSVKAPKNIQLELQKPIQDIETQIAQSPKLTPQTQKLFFILKEVGEISYSDLYKRMGMESEDGLRGFLSVVDQKTGMIERFEKEGNRKKWVRLKKAQNDSIPAQSLNQSGIFDESRQSNDQTNA